MKADFSRVTAQKHCQRLPLRRCRVHKVPSAFTLVEILVVVFIVAVLIGLLLPQLGVAKEYFRRASCASNLRQIHACVTAYMKDYDDVFPLYDVGASGQMTKNAPTQLDEKLNVLMPRYVKNPKIFQCPTRLVVGSGTKKLSYHYQYNPNLSFSGSGAGKPPRLTMGAHIRNPGALRLLWDSFEESKNGGYDEFCNHGANGGYVLYSDGHLKWFSGAAFRADEEMDPDLLVKK